MDHARLLPRRRGGSTTRQCVEISGTQEAAIDGGCPDWIAANAGGAGHWVARYDTATAQRLERNAARIPEYEAVARVVDARLLMGTGLMPRTDALHVAETFLAHPGPGPKHAAVELLEDVRRDVLTAAQAAQLDRIERRLVLPLARRIGWTPRRGEGLAIQDLRGPLLDDGSPRHDARSP